MTGVFQDSLAFVSNFAQLTAEDIPERVMSCSTTANYFEVLRLNPALGSFYGQGTSEMEGDASVVLDYNYWQTRFGGNPDVIGKNISLNGHPATISGVAPKLFQGTTGLIRTNVYVPLRVGQYVNSWLTESMEDRSGFAWKVISRLQPGVDLEQARQAVTTRAASLSQEYPESNKNVRGEVFPEPLTRLEPSAADYFPMVARIFMGLVSLVLMIACANVASLLLVRAAGRSKEIAVRTAMGAPRWTIVRQLLIESLLISGLGGLCGLLLAQIVTNLLASIRVASDVPFVFDFSLDYQVLAFAAVVTFVTGIVAGLFPALRAVRRDLFESLREAGRGTEGSSRQSLRSVLVITQVAVSLVLLVCTGLFLRSMINVGSMDPGFEVENRAMLAVDTALLNYDDDRAKSFFRDLLTEVRSLPGVLNAATSASLPMGFSNFGDHVFLEGAGSGETKEDEARTILYDVVSAGYFETMGFRTLQGRVFTERDTEDSLRVAVVNQHLAETIWPGQNPIGKRFSLSEPGEPYVEVVGVVNTAFYSVPGESSQEYFYLPSSQKIRKEQFILAHTAGTPESLLPALREKVRNLNPDMPVFDVRTMKTHVQDGKAAILFRLPTILVGMFALIGAVLAATGLYGLISYSVYQRQHEIGVRLALGASSGNIIRLVSKQGILLAAIGVTGGLGLATLVTRLISNILIGVSALDPLTYGVVALLLLAVAAFSCFFPARARAGRIDPLEALRT